MIRLSTFPSFHKSLKKTEKVFSGVWSADLYQLSNKGAKMKQREKSDEGNRTDILPFELVISLRRRADSHQDPRLTFPANIRA